MSLAQVFINFFAIFFLVDQNSLSNPLLFILSEYVTLHEKLQNEYHLILWPEIKLYGILLAKF